MEWMYNHPRSAGKAIGCKHLQITTFAQQANVPEEEVSSLVQANAEGKVRFKTRAVLQQPAVGFVCGSPVVNEQLSAVIPVLELRAQWKTTLIPSELCTICPCWEKR